MRALACIGRGAALGAVLFPSFIFLMVLSPLIGLAVGQTIWGPPLGAVGLVVGVGASIGAFSTFMSHYFDEFENLCGNFTRDGVISTLSQHSWEYREKAGKISGAFVP